MSVLEIYINWVNSVLGEAGGHVDGVEAVQDGKVLCELIDVLAPDAGLQAKVKASGDCTPLAYITAALEHMKSHDIKIKFPAEDIIHNEIKSMLDVLWILILNYGIHFIGQNAFQRSVGIGKKNLLEWCQEELDTTFDPRNTLTFNLCNGSWFVKLLEKVAGCSMQKSEDKSEYIDTLLTEIQDRYLIRKEIIKASDIVDGTVDEHTLMIYLSLIKRRVSNSERHSRREMFSTDGKAAAMAKIHNFEQRARSLSSDRSKSADSLKELGQNRGKSSSGGGRSSSANSDMAQIRNRSRSLFDQVTGDGNETSDWSSTGSLFSGREKSSPKQGSSPSRGLGGEEILHQTISERVTEHLPELASDKEDVRKEMESQRISEKETDTLSEFSSTSLSREKLPMKSSTPRRQYQSDTSKARNGAVSSGNGKRSPPTSSSHEYSSSQVQRTIVSESVSNGRKKEHGGSESNGEEHTSKLSQERPRNRDSREENVRIRIKRPKDYIRQWEDTMDRLSGASVTDEYGSPRSSLISSYKVSIPPRSKSTDLEITSTRQTNVTSHRTYISGPRSKSTDAMPEITISSADPRGPKSGVQTSLSDETRLPSSSVRSAALSEEGFDSILDRLPENMRQTAKEASKFLMHTSGPEVIALIDAIKQARENVHSPMAKDDERPQRHRNISSPESTEQTILKRSHNPESSPPGSRVRFQPTASRSQGGRRAQSDGLRTTTSHSTTSSVSPQLSSSSPRRRAISSNGVNSDGEKGSDTMLSVSPRSRSMSPRAIAHSTGDQELDTKSPRILDSTESASSSASRPLREELLLKNLGLNTRVIEDERPSSRLKALNMSPRNSTMDSPGRMYTSSPRKPVVERLSVNTAYPEVTRLDLGLDSDRSYISAIDDGREDSPPPLRRGGSGRVPRREAWEQERRRREEPSIIGIRPDTAGQSRFIDVLCKEIENLKQRIELMEDDGGRRSLSRQARSPSAIGHTRPSTSYTTREIRTENNKMVLAPRTSTVTSPIRDRATSCPLLQVSSRSTATRSSPRRTVVTSDAVKRPVATYSGSLHNSGIRTNPTSTPRGRSISPQQQDRITLGYASPARSVTPEIWGNDLHAPGDLETDRQEKWKQLISRRNLTDAEVIELKQALACAIVENDIIHAKLNNARHEIHDKLNHTNSVLDDCRRHLAKAQAENMELRTMFEKEKHRSEDYEGRIRELENDIFEVKTDNQQLENKLEQAAALLDRTVTETKPGVDALKAENSKLISRLASVENDNDSLTEEVHNLKRSQAKAMNTMDDLRECLSRVRRERQELFEEVTSLHRREQSARVRDIITNYQEKGAGDEREREQDLLAESSRSYFQMPGPDERSFFNSMTSPRQSFRRSYDDDDILHRSSPRVVTPRRSASQHRDSSLNDLSPSGREIYPHRKSYTPRSRSCSPNRFDQRASSPGYRSPPNFDESLIDQTLQEIEHDMQKERQRILSRSRSPSVQRRLRFPSYPAEGNTDAPTRKGATSARFNSHKSPGRLAGNSYSSNYSRLNQSSQDSSLNKPYSARGNASDRLNRSFSSLEDLRQQRSRSSSPMTHSSRLGIPRASDQRSGDDSCIFRSQSPSFTRQEKTTVETSRSSTVHQSEITSTSLDRSRSPKYFPRESHSPPTRLSPDDKEKKRRPLHDKSEMGQFARNLQKEFDKEDKLIKALSKSPDFQNKSWFEMQRTKMNEFRGLRTRQIAEDRYRNLIQTCSGEEFSGPRFSRGDRMARKTNFSRFSESDGDDTGINSSMSSRSSCERSFSRKKTPLLSDEQRRYADELIQKYTGNPPMK